MNIPDKQPFLSRIPPFDQLDEGALSQAAEGLTLRHYADQQVILKRWENPRYFYLVIDGAVEERDADGAVARHDAGDAFDARALIEGRSSHSFVAQGDCSCYLLPAPLFLALTRNHPDLHNYYYQDLSRRLDALVVVQQQREAAAFMMTRIGDGNLQPPVFAHPETSIREAAELMKTRKTTAVLIRRDGQTGIFTARDIREQAVLGGRPETSPIGGLAHYNLITLEQDDFLFNALILMTRHEIRHLVITHGGEILGMLEQKSLLAHLSGHSYLIGSRIERAATIDELKEAGDGVNQLIRSLHERGVKPRYIARVVTDLNRKLFRRLYEQLAPPELIANACFMVMGSEGRGEQLLKTDQDNALIVADGHDFPGLAEWTGRFTEALVKLGYPRCPGNIMVANPDWAKPLTAFKEDLFRWIHCPDDNARMNLAIFYDASPAAGRSALLEELREYLFYLLSITDATLRYFALATLAFNTPLGLFNRFVLQQGPRPGLDIKKGGLFPIVHGVRSLALEYHIRETNTIARIQSLSGRGLFEDRFTADLIEAFEFMSMLRLRAQLEALERDGGRDNTLEPRRLNKLEQNLLKDSLTIVKEFKQFISYHFKLNMVS